MEKQLAERYACIPDVLERVIDKGIVLDAWLRVSRGEIDLSSVDTLIVVASVTPSDPAAPPLTAPDAPASPRQDGASGD